MYLGNRNTSEKPGGPFTPTPVSPPDASGGVVVRSPTGVPAATVEVPCEVTAEYASTNEVAIDPVYGCKMPEKYIAGNWRVYFATPKGVNK